MMMPDAHAAQAWPASTDKPNIPRKPKVTRLTASEIESLRQADIEASTIIKALIARDRAGGRAFWATPQTPEREPAVG